MRTYCKSKGQHLCWQRHRNRQLEREYLPCMRILIMHISMYATANSCVDRLDTEGGRDPTSRLTNTADKRRKRTTPAETNEQKQERLKETGADTLLNGWLVTTRQREYFAAETAANKDARLQQIRSVPFPQTEWLAAESATETIQLQQMSVLQCETKRLTAETFTERDTRFCSRWEIDWQLRPPKKEMPGLNMTEQDTGTVQSSLPFFQQCSGQGA